MSNPKRFKIRKWLGYALLFLFIAVCITGFAIWTTPILTEDYLWEQRFEFWFSAASGLGAAFVITWWPKTIIGSMTVFFATSATVGALWQIWWLAGGMLLLSFICDAIDSRPSIFKR